MLKKFESTPIHVTRKLSKAISPSFHASRASAATTKGTFGSRKLKPGNHCTVFMACAESSLDKSHQPGDFLSGTMSYCNGEMHQKWLDYGEGKVPGGYPCRVVVGGGKATSAKATATAALNQCSTPGELKSRKCKIHEWCIQRLRKEFEGKKTYDEEYKIVLADLDNDRETVSKDEYVVLSTMLAQSRLHHGDTKERKFHYLGAPDKIMEVIEIDIVDAETKQDTTEATEATEAKETTEAKEAKEAAETVSFADVIQAADQLIEIIDRDALSTHFGQKIPEADKEGQKIRKHMTTLRSILRDALKRKMHALLSMSSVEQDKKLLNEHWEEIQRWCDVKGMECEHVSYRYAVWKGETGASLKILLSMIDKYDGKKHLATESVLRGELLALYEKIGWDHLVDNEKRWQQLHCPTL